MGEVSWLKSEIPIELKYSKNIISIPFIHQIHMELKSILPVQSSLIVLFNVFYQLFTWSNINIAYISCISMDSRIVNIFEINHEFMKVKFFCEIFYLKFRHPWFRILSIDGITLALGFSNRANITSSCSPSSPWARKHQVFSL